MIGDKYANLIVLEEVNKNKRNERMWLCQCDCGNKKIIKGYNLKIGKTKSCGCIKTGIKPKNRINLKLNDFILIKFIEMDKNRISLWLAKCKCGKEKIIRSNTRVKSCGCRKKETDSNRSGKNNPRYNPLLSDESRNDKRLYEGYDKWRFQIKEKYQFQCIVCGDDRGGNLISHHLNSYHDNIDERLSTKNGVCLCEICHKKFHKEYGYGKNNKYQFFEFMKKYCIFVKNKNHNESVESFKRDNKDFYTSISG
jgi:hypothetical protein